MIVFSDGSQWLPKERDANKRDLADGCHLRSRVAQEADFIVQVDILGVGGRQFLRRLLANDVDRLERSGKALYSCMCNEHGGIIDDLIVYQRAVDNYRLVLNSATRANDLAWIKKHSDGCSLGLQERPELAMLAVQGPEAIAKVCQIVSSEKATAIAKLSNFECVDIDDWFFARTGYTGEDGLEIVMPATVIVDFWKNIIASGIKPCGLGARDTLRLEAGFLLYGQDMDATTSPLESGLAWTIAWTPEERNFIGMGAMLGQKEQGLTRKLVGLILKDKGIMRSGQTVIIPDEINGEITSGSYSPTLGCSIALARVPIKTQGEVMVDIRGKLMSATVRTPRFVKHGVAI